jgi:hypothetical protein
MDNPISPSKEQVMAFTAAQIAQAFLNCRDKIEEIEARHKQELAAPKAALEKLRIGMLQTLDAAGAQNIKIPGVGTMFKKLQTSVSVKDWESSLEWVRTGGRWDFLERRMNKTAVVAFAEENAGQLPPGVSMTQAYEATVQRGS